MFLGCCLRHGQGLIYFILSWTTFLFYSTSYFVASCTRSKHTWERGVIFIFRSLFHIWKTIHFLGFLRVEAWKPTPNIIPGIFPRIVFLAVRLSDESAARALEKNRTGERQMGIVNTAVETTKATNTHTHTHEIGLRPLSIFWPRTRTTHRVRVAFSAVSPLQASPPVC